MALQSLPHRSIAAWLSRKIKPLSQAVKQALIRRFKIIHLYQNGPGFTGS